VFNDLSKELWKVEGDTYSGMLVEGKPMSVKKNNELNRIRAYMHNKGLDKDDIAVALLHAVYSNASSAKSEMSYEDARSVIINMYLFVAELIRKTDMRPVNKIE
jgi:hypothetical protein